MELYSKSKFQQSIAKNQNSIYNLKPLTYFKKQLNLNEAVKLIYMFNQLKINYLPQKWKISVVMISLIPLLPEYIAPLLAIVAFSFAYADAKENMRKIQVGITGRIILLYIAYTALGLIYSSGKSSTLQTVLMFITMFLVYLSAFNIISGRRRLDFVFFGISISAGIAGLIAFIQYLGYIFFRTGSIYIWEFVDKTVYNYLPIRVLLTKPSGRMSSTFNNPNIFAEFMIMAFPFAVYYSFIGINKIYQKISTVAIFSIAFGVAFSFSRSGYLALVLIMAIYAVSKIRKYTMVITGVLSAFLISQRPVMERFFSIPDIDNSTAKRFDIWLEGIRIIRRRPIFGNGAGVENIWNILRNHGIDTPHMHNIVIQVLSEGGIIGLILFAGIIWQMLKTAFILLEEETYAHIVGITLIAFITGFMTTGMTDYPLMTPKLVGIFLLVAGIADGGAKIYTVKQPVNILGNILTLNYP